MDEFIIMASSKATGQTFYWLPDDWNPSQIDAQRFPSRDAAQAKIDADLRTDQSVEDITIRRALS